MLVALGAGIPAIANGAICGCATGFDVEEYRGFFQKIAITGFITIGIPFPLLLWHGCDFHSHGVFIELSMWLAALSWWPPLACLTGVIAGWAYHHGKVEAPTTGESNVESKFDKTNDFYVLWKEIGSMSARMRWHTSNWSVRFGAAIVVLVCYTFGFGFCPPERASGSNSYWHLFRACCLAHCL